MSMLHVSYSPAMTALRLVVRIATTLLAILVGVPVLVIAAADLHLDPRHWSGTRLSGVNLSAITFQECPPSAYSVPGRTRSQADMDAARDAVEAGITRDNLEAVFQGGLDPCHDRYEVQVYYLDHRTLTALSRYGDAVAVRLNPYVSGHAVLDAAGPTPGEGAVIGTAVPYRVLPYWLSHQDPVGTWFTLLTGFPLYLASVLAILAAWWALAIRRHLRRRRALASEATPDAAPAS
jgi:hypothetical protein